MMRSCKKRLPYWEFLLIRAGCLYRIAHSDCLPPVPTARQASLALFYLSCSAASFASRNAFRRTVLGRFGMTRGE